MPVSHGLSRPSSHTASAAGEGAERGRRGRSRARLTGVEQCTAGGVELGACGSRRGRRWAAAAAAGKGRRGRPSPRFSPSPLPHVSGSKRPERWEKEEDVGIGGGNVVGEGEGVAARASSRASMAMSWPWLSLTAWSKARSSGAEQCAPGGVELGAGWEPPWEELGGGGGGEELGVGSSRRGRSGAAAAVAGEGGCGRPSCWSY
uniref:Uncharacterized protein n=1 Tax=Oryza sativa subsp. japonica TaxID=39947 RepID=Q2QN12_ORYSJ|nr:hypothetical protein LOC_Os12g39350 [Oryza sativa Japonica Group]